ncbi:hypothetical protein KUCAC02_010304 [Chaenocephalus aceratus]|uniref:Uncharacterized protein n=1 Tax=Chaenocephalus aceratus TaxID=36190 RepID=A0ACB9VYT9_CHAAC|nr:hypothetical protein KUCAC02_010304 [Chaenocephalus aceratus]
MCCTATNTIQKQKKRTPPKMDVSLYPQSPELTEILEEAGTSKVYCLTCEKSEGNISLESLSYNVVMSFCDKHAAGPQEKNASGDSPDQRPDCRRLSFGDKQNGTPSKRRSKVSWALLRDDSSNSGDNEPDSITAPLDTDIDDSEHLVCEPLMQSLMKHNESHRRSTSEDNLEGESRDGASDEDETINSEAESESLLLLSLKPLPASQADFSTQTSPVSLPVKFGVRRRHRQTMEEVCT